MTTQHRQLLGEGTSIDLPSDPPPLRPTCGRIRIAAAGLGGGYMLIAFASDGGVIRFRLYTCDGIFDDGFESID